MDRRLQVPVVLPKRNDPRLRVSAVIIAIQILGQTVLNFKVSIAQILVTVGMCALIDTAVTFGRHRVLAWPASALLTGNSVALILRANGTRHGDYWSLHGIQYFVLAALLSLGSKYLIRPAGHHVFNPSNLGIVGCLLLMGPTRVFPQYLWWGPFGLRVAAAVAVIVAGGIWILRPLGLLPTAVSFLGTFAVLVGVLAISGHTFYAIWHRGPVGGVSYWVDICGSPEVLIFALFMITDPQTAPRAPGRRIIYGAGIAVGASALVAMQGTEYGIKVGILAALTVACAVIRIRARSGAATAASLAIALGALAGTSALASNKQVRRIERGLTSGRRTPSGGNGPPGPAGSSSQ